MQYSVSIGQIEQRAKASGLCLKTLAHMAGLHPSTAYRGAKPGADVKVSTAARLFKQLENEELRLLGHLVALYPQRALELATVALCPQQAPQREAAE